MARLLEANAAVQKKITAREPGVTANSPMVDGKAIPGPSLGSQGARAVGEHSLAHRLRAHRGDALRPADAREAGARRSRAARTRVEAAWPVIPRASSKRSARRIQKRRRGIYGFSSRPIIREAPTRASSRSGKPTSAGRRCSPTATTGKRPKVAATCGRRTPSRFSSCSITSRSQGH